MNENRVTKDGITRRIERVSYTRIEGTTITIAALTLDNGYTVTGESACADSANFDKALGESIAYDNAFEKLWALEGYLLRERLSTEPSVSNYARTAAWLAACGKVPGPVGVSIQIGCDLEESIELYRTILIDVPGDSTHGLNAIVTRALDDLEFVAAKLKSGEANAIITDREEALDAICDREVTGNGVAYFAGFAKPSADAAVLDSNDAKLVDGKPVILPGGKIGKPEGWTAPDLSRFV